MLKRFWGSIFLVLLTHMVVWAQDSSLRTQAVYQYKSIDSVTLAKLKFKKDSLSVVGDSLARMWVKTPDPNRPNQFLDSLIQLYTLKNFDFAAFAKKFPKKSERLHEGKLRPAGESWILAVVLSLVLFFAILKSAFSKELASIVQSFYSNRVLSQINKEDNLFSSWPFFFLYLLFGLTIGMWLYLSGKYLHFDFSFSGFEWFLILSVSVIGLFTLKILALRMLGFLFGIQKLVKEYVVVLYLSYFNTAIIFLPLIIGLSLSPYNYAEIYSYLAILLLIIVIVVQFLRTGVNVLSNYQFPKIYLFIYLCALEICPLLILIKVLRV
ncbi:MAG TPA: DUF4271 domain-containing protein [Daejeonella sp.]|nr:DUF4271 domain-containing protein [Daejeonella sp.]